MKTILVFTASLGFFLGTSLISHAAPNRVLVLNGTNAYLTVSPTTALNQLGTNFTVEAWGLNDHFVPGGARILDKGWYGLTFTFNDVDNHIFCAVPGFGPTSVDTFHSPTGVPFNTWHHFAFTFDGMSRRIFIDGQMVAEGPYSKAVVLNNSQLCIGGNSSSAVNLLDGKLDDVRVWSMARSEADIQADMCGLAAGPHDGLIARWTFNDDDGTDISGNGHTATFVGGAITVEEEIDCVFDSNEIAEVFNGDIKVKAGNLIISWPVVGGNCYRVQYRDSETDSEWDFISPPICETDSYPDGTQAVINYTVYIDGPVQAGLYRIARLK